MAARHFWRAGVGVAWAALLACGGAAPAGVPPVPLVATPIQPSPEAGSAGDDGDARPALDAALLGEVPEGTFGPYVGTSSHGARLALWAAMVEGRGRRWFSLPLDPKGTPLGSARELADAPNDLTLAHLAATRDGFMALATAASANGTRIEALQLGASGELVAGPTLIAHGRSEILWINGLSLGGTRLSLWAAWAGPGVADVQLAALESPSRPWAPPVTVLEGARAWQAVAFGDGVALAAVVNGPEGTELRVLFLGADGSVLAKTDVVRGKQLEPQIDAVAVGDRLALAWTEREGLDTRIWTATLAGDARLVAPAQPAVERFGRQRLVQLVPPAQAGDAAVLVWERAAATVRGQRRLQVAPLGPDGHVTTPRSEIELVAEPTEQPEIVRKAAGLAALVRAPACPRADPGDESSGCVASEAVPTFVELGPELEVLASEPLRLADAGERRVELAWGLGCDDAICSALGAVAAAPVPVYGIELRPRSTGWAPAATPVTGRPPPRATELRTLEESVVLADLATAAVGDRWLLAALGDFDETTPYVRPKTPAPDGRYAPVRAILSARVVSQAASPARIVSYRARSTSGIALAPAPDQRALLAWTAIDGGAPEVFATLLDRDGQVVLQRMISTGAGNVTGLGASAVAGGFVVAWVSDRGSAGAHLHAMRLASNLRGGDAQRVSEAPVARASLGMLARGEHAWVAWIGEAGTTLSVVQLDGKTGARVAENVVVRRSGDALLASPALAAKGDGALLGWVEHPDGSSGSVGYVVELDVGGKPVSEPVRVEARASELSGMSLHCARERCLGALDARTPTGHALAAFVWPGNGSALSAPILVKRSSAPADLTAFSAGDGVLFYADRQGRRGFIRHLAVAPE